MIYADELDALKYPCVRDKHTGLFTAGGAMLN
jgi:hypothetical protein